MNNVYKVISDRILNSLKQGIVPWHKPWTVSSPKNLISKKEYQGINSIILSIPTFTSSYWVTFNQCKTLGGNVKKGEKGFPCLFFRSYDKENEFGKTDHFVVAKYYTIFNITQCEGIDDKIPNEDLTVHQPISECEKLFSSYTDRPVINHGGNKACYFPSLDKIDMPIKESFENSQAYYATLFHEMIHSTGHKSRLNRKGITNTVSFGSNEYSFEELIAEIGSAFLCSKAGIDNIVFDNSASYIAGWIKILDSDSKCIVQAASAAQKATNYILKKDVNDE